MKGLRCSGIHLCVKRGKHLTYAGSKQTNKSIKQSNLCIFWLEKLI